MKAFLFLFLGLLMGFFMVALLPLVFIVWFDAWWRRHEIDALLSVLCDGGEENIPESILPESIERLPEWWWN